ncbi:MAG: DUF3102 domain-containing protein [Scytonema sp. PMC 1069.18]|nr:DUF3102 domain-containing protein [Scytonema sp. PMC 1069.18]MEC4883845.1 DUF3102 domain-containing protein [Scytonema sp. PMC 1070.18]
MTQTDLGSVASKQISAPEAFNFDYSNIDPELFQLIQQRTNEIKSLMRRSAQDIIDIGQKLIEVKQHLGHGKFRKWLNHEFSWSVSSANKFMHVANQFKCVNFTHLNLTASVIYLLASPSTSSAARAETLELAYNGENITYAKAKEIVYKHRGTASCKGSQPVSTDISVESTESVSGKLSKRLEPRILNVDSASEELTKKAVEAGENAPYLYAESAAPTRRCEMNNIPNLPTARHKIENEVISDIAIGIKNLTPEQLAAVIHISVSHGLSTNHLKILIETSREALEDRQEVCV